MAGTAAGPALSGAAKTVLLTAFLAATAAKEAMPPAQSPIGGLPATFVGVLPCADCRGIRYQLALLPNSRFAESVLRLHDRVIQGIELSHGIWRISSESRTLTLDAGSDAAGEDMRSAWQVKDARTLCM